MRYWNRDHTVWYKIKQQHGKNGSIRSPIPVEKPNCLKIKPVLVL
jgi:hypothetical protein